MLKCCSCLRSNRNSQVHAQTGQVTGAAASVDAELCGPADCNHLQGSLASQPSRACQALHETGGLWDAAGTRCRPLAACPRAMAFLEKSRRCSQPAVVAWHGCLQPYLAACARSPSCSSRARFKGSHCQEAGRQLRLILGRAAAAGTDKPKAISLQFISVRCLHPTTVAYLMQYSSRFKSIADLASNTETDRLSSCILAVASRCQAFSPAS